ASYAKQKTAWVEKFRGLVMKAKQKRWIQSVVATAKTTDTKLPYQRGNRAAVAARLKQAAERKAA
ncbi:MAG: hypothetical protein ACPH5G_19950, partial [Pseudooceanicola atlanticus]